MWFTLRYHRHKNLENAILDQAKEISDLKLQLASIYGKIAVKARETKKKTNVDAEIAAIQKQLGGDVVAVMDESGKIIQDQTEEE